MRHQVLPSFVVVLGAFGKPFAVSFPTTALFFDRCRGPFCQRRAITEAASPETRARVKSTATQTIRFSSGTNGIAFGTAHRFGTEPSKDIADEPKRGIPWAPRGKLLPFASTRRTRSLRAAGFATKTTSLEGAISSADDGAAATTKSYKLDGAGVPGGTRVETTTDTGHKIATDVPKTMGGRDTAPQPVEMLLAAWMGCTQATASFVGRQLLPRRSRNEAGGKEAVPGGRKRGRRPRTELLLEFDGIEAFRDERGALELPVHKTPGVPSRVRRIAGTIEVSVVRSESDGTNHRLLLDPEELALLREQTEARCPIANMILESGCEIDVEWVQASDD